MKLIPSLLSLATLIIASPQSKAALLLDYVSASSTDNATIAATHVASGLTGIDLSAGTGLSNGTGGSYNWKGWTEASSSAAVTGGDVFTWGLDIDAGFVGSLDISSLDIRYDRSGTGPSDIEIAYAINGGGFSTFHTDSAVSDTGSNHSIDLSGITALQDLAAGSEITFRLVGWGASGSSGTFDLENTSAFDNTAIRINGAVPEPSAALLAALALPALLRRRR